MRERLILLARAVPLVLTPAAYQSLAFECGGPDGATALLIEIVEEADRPIGLNLGSRTVFLASTGWSAERLSGYVAGLRHEIEEAFGPSEVWR